MKFKLLLILLLTTFQVRAQKTGSYFQFGIYPEYNQMFYKSKIQSINESEYYWNLSISDNAAKYDLKKIDSIAFIKKSTTRSSLKLTNNLPCPNLICLMNKDQITWNLLINPVGLQNQLDIINYHVIDENLYIYCKILADSLRFQLNLNEVKYFNTPNISGYSMIKINKNGQAELENFIPSNQSSRLLSINNNNYVIYLESRPSTPLNKSLLESKIQNNLVHDSLLTAIIIKYEFGNNSAKNWISGTFPIEMYTTGDLFLNSSRKNKILIPGNYFGQNAIYNLNLPYNPRYKIDSNSINPISKPLNFDKSKSYLYWAILDIDKWSFDEIKFSLIKGSLIFEIENYGIIGSDYWFFAPTISQVATDKPNPTWISNNKIFFYNTQNQIFNSYEFPENTVKVMQDADSLLLLAGGNMGAPTSIEYLDFDNSPDNHYPIKNNYFLAEYRPNGKLVWARYGNLVFNDFSPYNLSSNGNTRFISTTQGYFNDLDLGFKYLRKSYLSDASGCVFQLTKAPICDFDIEQITYNHVTINYKGALNANFYYKFGDGSKDSNYNQRYFIHSYKKTGTFLLYCIAKNDFGRDTAYYELDIYDIVSTTKLNKNNSIKLFPNPTENTLSWEAEATTHVDIFDTNAKFIERIQTTQNSINIGHLPAGIYMVSVHTKNGSFINKVVKQ